MRDDSQLAASVFCWGLDQQIGLKGHRSMADKNEVLKRLDMKQYYGQLFPAALNGKIEITVASPFREDIHPSLSINLESGLWIDHGVGESVDFFSLEQRTAVLDFPTAVESRAAIAEGYVAQESATGPNQMTVFSNRMRFWDGRKPCFPMAAGLKGTEEQNSSMQLLRTIGGKRVPMWNNWPNTRFYGQFTIGFPHSRRAKLLQTIDLE